MPGKSATRALTHICEPYRADTRMRRRDHPDAAPVVLDYRRTQTFRQVLRFHWSSNPFLGFAMIFTITRTFP